MLYLKSVNSLRNFIRFSGVPEEIITTALLATLTISLTNE